MPTLSSSKIPPPRSWEEFENITRDALAIKWNSPNLQKNGRKGQPQWGVDVFGEDHLGRLVGIQCKNQEVDTTVSLVRQELSKAECFEPPLDAWFMAVTHEADSELQEDLRMESQERVETGRFPVGIFFWDDIVQELLKEPATFSKYYPEFDSVPTELPRPSGLRLVCLLDIAYYGSNLADLTERMIGPLTFALGVRGESRDLRDIAKTLVACAKQLMLRDDFDSLESLAEQFTQRAIQHDASPEFGEGGAYSEAIDLARNIQGEIDCIEYELEGRDLTTFSVGTMLGRWYVAAPWRERLSHQESVNIEKGLLRLRIDEERIAEAMGLTLSFNLARGIEKIRAPHRVFNIARTALQEENE